MQLIYSPDGQWWWDGTAWQPAWMAPPPPPPGMFWFFSAPSWVGRLLLMGLIGVIPIAGTMLLCGWCLAARDNLRAGILQVPRAGFHYIGRGARVWVAQIVYGLISLPVFGIEIAGLVAGIEQGNAGLIVLFALLLVLWSIFAIVIVYFLAAAIFELADAEGIGAGANPARAWAAAMADTGNSWGFGGRLFLGLLITTAIGSVIPFGNVLLGGVPLLMGAPALARFSGAGARRLQVPPPPAGGQSLTP